MHLPVQRRKHQGKLNFKCKYELAYSQNVHAGNETIEHIWSLLNSSEGYKGCCKRRLQFEWQKPAKSSPNVICLPQKNDTLKLKGKHHLKSLNLKKIVDLHARYTITQHHSMLNHIPNHNPQTPSLTTRLSTKTSAHPMAVGERTPEKTRMRIPGPQHRHTTPNTPPSEPLKPESLTQAISRFLLFGTDPSPTPYL